MMKLLCHNFYSLDRYTCKLLIFMLQRQLLYLWKVFHISSQYLLLCLKLMYIWPISRLTLLSPVGRLCPFSHLPLIWDRLLHPSRVDNRHIFSKIYKKVTLLWSSFDWMYALELKLSFDPLANDAFHYGKSYKLRPSTLIFNGALFWL